MARRQGGHKTSSLVFPSNWTSKWLRNAIQAEPKWQLQAILNSYKYANWIAFESMALNGLQLSPRGNPQDNFVRSIEAGIAISYAAQQYNSVPRKVPIEQKVELLKEITSAPIVGDMIRTVTEANLPIMTPPPAYEVQLKAPPAEVEEIGARPVQTIKIG